MSYFIKLRNWFTSQEHLLFLFALLFIVPNCVLFFTEPLPVTVGIASLILPYAFWVGLLLLARKPGIVLSFWRIGDCGRYVSEPDQFDCI